jgi:hypothetical protein
MGWVSLPNHDLTTRLIAALEMLKTNYVVPDGKLAYRIMIPAIARQLTKMTRLDVSPKVVKEAKKELTRLASDARSLASRIPKLPLEVSLLLDATGGFQPSNLDGLLNELADAAQIVATAKAASSGKAGRPPKSTAENIVTYLCQEYERLTGKPPTLTVRDGRAGGAFLDLVKAVFDALRIKASPEATVRRVIEKIKIQGP